MIGALKNALSRQPSSFQPTAWDKLDAGWTVDSFPVLGRMEEGQLDKYGRSLVREALYALDGLAIDETDPMASAWRSVTSQASFVKMRSSAGQDRVAKVVQAVSLSGLIERELKSEQRREAQQDGQMSDEIDQRMAEGASFEDAVAQVTEQDDEPGQIGIVIGEDDLEQAQEEGTELAVLVRGLAASLEGLPNERIEKAIDMIELFDVSLFAKLLGWSQRLVSGAVKSTRSATGEMTGYSPDTWSDAVTPDEMLAVAEGKLDALARLAEGSLTTTTHRSDEPMGRGPVVVMRDESGSMWLGRSAKAEGTLTTTTGTHRDALSLEVALAEVFNREKRDLVSVRWGSKAEDPYTYGEPGLEEHLRSFQDGGTNLINCMQTAIDVAYEYEQGADILVLTDARLGRETDDAGWFVDQMTELTADFRDNGGRVWVVVLGRTTEEQAAPFLTGWTDGWSTIAKIEASDGLGDILQAMASEDMPEGRVRL